jgi:hypothetical protein
MPSSRLATRSVAYRRHSRAVKGSYPTVRLFFKAGPSWGGSPPLRSARGQRRLWPLTPDAGRVFPFSWRLWTDLNRRLQSPQGLRSTTELQSRNLRRGARPVTPFGFAERNVTPRMAFPCGYSPELLDHVDLGWRPPCTDDSAEAPLLARLEPLRLPLAVPPWRAGCAWSSAPPVSLREPEFPPSGRLVSSRFSHALSSGLAPALRRTPCRHDGEACLNGPGLRRGYVGFAPLAAVTRGYPISVPSGEDIVRSRAVLLRDCTIEETGFEPAPPASRTQCSSGLSYSSSSRKGWDSNPRNLRPPVFETGAIGHSATLPVEHAGFEPAWTRLCKSRGHP